MLSSRTSRDARCERAREARQPPGVGPNAIGRLTIRHSSQIFRVSDLLRAPRCFVYPPAARGETRCRFMVFPLRCKGAGLA